MQLNIQNIPLIDFRINAIIKRINILKCLCCKHAELVSIQEFQVSKFQVKKNNVTKKRFPHHFRKTSHSMNAIAYLRGGQNGPVTLLRMRETYEKRMKINEIIFIRTKII